MRSQFVFQEIWIGLRRNLTMTMALIVVVAISLSLLGTGLLFVKQVDRTRTYWQGKVELSIYLCIKTSPSPQCQQNGPATAAQRAQSATSRLASMPQVERRLLREPAAGLHRVQAVLLQPPALGPGHPGRRHPRLLPGEAANPEADYNVVASAVHRRARGGNRGRRDDHPGQVLPAARRRAGTR